MRFVSARECPPLGTSSLWLRSEKVFKSWEELKVAIGKEFPDTLDVKKIHELMSSRPKRKDETCIDYMLVMKELGKRGKIPDYLAIKYIVDGIVDDERNKIMLYGVSTYADLKEKLKLYATFKINSAKNSQRGKSYNNDMSRSGNRRNENQMMRCYSCGEKGHASEECSHRSQGKKCFRCNDAILNRQIERVSDT
uniref:CCHC-type domain-containing protein n=1 Tax=Heliothis virescens TaxID=7102 RepID=A0A2A4JCK9_HELVI